MKGEGVANVTDEAVVYALNCKNPAHKTTL